jgi:hypothetical protein
MNRNFRETSASVGKWHIGVWEITYGSRETVLPILGRTFQPVRRKNSATEKKSGQLLTLTGRPWVQGIKCLGVIQRIRGENQIVKRFGSFSAFPVQNRPNSAADLPDQSTFFRPLINYAAEQQPVGNIVEKVRRITLLVHVCGCFSADGT